MILNQRQAADLIGRSVGYLRASDCPRNEDGTYSGVDVAMWYVAKETAVVDELKTQKTQAEIELLEAREAKLSLENGIAAGDLVPSDSIDFFPAVHVVQRAGELVARKRTLTGIDAAAIIENAANRFRVEIDSRLPAT